MDFYISNMYGTPKTRHISGTGAAFFKPCKCVEFYDERVIETSDYWHREYICPFWQAAGKKTIRCEGECVLAFPERRETNLLLQLLHGLISRFPCHGIAAAKLRYYERTE